MFKAASFTEEVMSKPLVTDELWGIVEPLLPKHDPIPKGGRPRVSDRVCFTGLLFVLKTGIPWEDFPCEMGCCGMTLLNRDRGEVGKTSRVRGGRAPWCVVTVVGRV